MTTSAFPHLTSDEQVFYDLLWTPMLTVGENWLEIEVPFLDLPIIKQFDEAILKGVTDSIFNALVLVIDVTAIKLVNDANQSAYDTASLQLRIIAEESGIKSDAYNQAKSAALVALSNFTQLPGA